MSGPKLMHVTTSPVALLVNAAVFIAVGKVSYFSPLIDGVNTDIENEIEWFENYVESVRTAIPEGNGSGGPGNTEINNSLRRIDTITKKYTNELKRRIIDKEILEELEAPEINEMLVRAVEMLPVKKEAFMKEVSEALQHVELVRKRVEANELARQREIARIEARKKEERRARERAAYDNNEKAYAEEMEGYIASLKEQIVLEKSDEGWGQIDYEDAMRPSKEEGTAPSDSDFPDISEQIKVEMISFDIESFLKMECQEDKEKELLHKIESDMENLNTENEFYSSTSKRVILNRLEMNYNALNKMIAKRKMNMAERMKLRGSLEAEYITYINAMELKAAPVEHMSLEELDKETGHLREMMLDRVKADYMEDAITEIMQKQGYSSVTATTLKDDGISCMVFENDENMNIRASLNDDMIMIEVVGNGENDPTPEEIKQIVNNQGELCRIYPTIKTELEEKGIHIESEVCAPISADTAKNIPINGKREKRKKKYGFGRIASSVPSGKEDVQRYLERTINKVQYMEAGQ